METEEKLPDHNPSQICPLCGKEYPIWRLAPDILHGKMRVWHNFCPMYVVEEITSVCMDCKMDGDKRAKALNSRNTFN